MKPIGWMKTALADVRRDAKKLPSWVTNSREGTVAKKKTVAAMRRKKSNWCRGNCGVYTTSKATKIGSHSLFLCDKCAKEYINLNKELEDEKVVDQALQSLEDPFETKKVKLPNLTLAEADKFQAKTYKEMLGKAAGNIHKYFMSCSTWITCDGSFFMISDSFSFIERGWLFVFSEHHRNFRYCMDEVKYYKIDNAGRDNPAHLYSKL